MTASCTPDPRRWHESSDLDPQLRVELEAERARRPSAPALQRMEERLLSQLEAESQVSSRAAAPRLRWVPQLVVAAAALLGLATTAWWANREPPPLAIHDNPGTQPLRVALPTGDALVLGPASRVRVDHVEPARREVQLVRGGGLFEVARLGSGQSFSVRTRDATFRVLGTIFTVEVLADRTVLRVYEGRVEVQQQVLRAGETWNSRGDAVTEKGSPVLHRAALDAARARSPRGALPHAVITLSWRGALPDRDPAPPPSAATRRVPAPPHVEPVQSVDSRWLQMDDEATEAEQRVAQVREQAHELIGRGQFSRALALIEPALTELHDGVLLWLRADAHRALGSDRQAALDYEAASQVLSGQARGQAGYRAAELWLHSLHDPGRCLDVLDAVRADANPSRVRERASVLRVEALLAAGRDGEAAEAAEHYLEREPHGDATSYMLELLGW